MKRMEQTDKQVYETPMAAVFEVKTEGVICGSNGQAGVQNYSWNDADEE